MRVGPPCAGGPDAAGVPHDLEALRRRIAALERHTPALESAAAGAPAARPWSLGVDTLDRALPEGGLTADGLHEATGVTAADGPPLLFTWRRVRRRVARAAGPERIEPEWWAGACGRDEAVRDYYRIEDADGRRYWLYRAGLYGEAGAGTGDSPRWYVHRLYG